MITIRTKDYADMSRAAADLIASQILIKPDCVLGLATGSTPIGTYYDLIQKYRRRDVSFKNVKTVNLDEYCGLSPTDSHSYHYFMQEHLFKHIDISCCNTYIPDGLNPVTECTYYDSIIDKLGPIDVQILGLGHNGHIGFNEPSDSFIPDTHKVWLSEQTINANTRFFNSKDDVPKCAYTMGIKPIMNAKTVLLLVSGKDKAHILKQALTGDITPKVPASILQLHPNLIIIADEDALTEF